jgi:hypothetical protein
MRTKPLAFLSTLAGLLLLATPLLAHHGYAAYDMQAIHSLKGTVTNFMIMNPHSQMSLDVKNPSGEVEHWIVEDIGGARGMKARGWDTLHAGDVVTVFFHPVKGEGHVGLLIRVEFPDGRVLPTPQQRPSAPGGDDAQQNQN